MIGYCYQVQVRENEDDDWAVTETLVSPPGSAPRQVLEHVRDSMKNNVRVVRVKQSADFINLVLNGMLVGVHDSCVGCPIEFEDRTMEPTQPWE
jgi:hypothetical protein